jgi:hypothetical protein
MKYMIAISAAGLLLTANAYGEKAKTKFDAELEAGAEYDSTLSVEELDRSTNQSDTAALLNGKLNGQWGATDRLTLKAGYSYQGKNYEDNSDFDFAIHQWHGDAAYDFSHFTLGASHYLAMADLDGNDLLDLNQSSIYASKLFDNHIFVRLAGNFKDKDFDSRPERDADSTGLEGDVYFFFNNARSFVSVGISSDEEDARSAELDYDSLGLKSKIQNKFTLLGKASKASLSYRYTDRDYDNITPQLGGPRSDRRQVAKLEWEMEMMPHLDIISALEYGDYDSNLNSVDYTETLASLSLRLKL